MNIQEIKKILQENQSWAKKAYGQHFLVDQSVLDKIIETADLKPSDRVVEVGPGLGVLTERLIEKAGEVVAIEADEFLANLMINKHINDKDNKLKLIVGDALQVIDQLEFKEKYLKPRSRIESGMTSGGYKVVANIPYSITSKLIRLFLENDYPPESLTLLVQKEVAERIVAQAGDMRMLALSVQYYAEAKIIQIVPASAFWPAPKVESGIIQISKIKNQNDNLKFKDQGQKLFKLARIGFSSRRKTLVNNISSGLRLEREKVIAIIKSVGLKETVRAQELSVSDWEEIAGRLVS